MKLSLPPSARRREPGLSFSCRTLFFWSNYEIRANYFAIMMHACAARQLVILKSAKVSRRTRARPAACTLTNRILFLARSLALDSSKNRKRKKTRREKTTSTSSKERVSRNKLRGFFGLFALHLAWLQACASRPSCLQVWLAPGKRTTKSGSLRWAKVQQLEPLLLLAWLRCTQDNCSNNNKLSPICLSCFLSAFYLFPVLSLSPLLFPAMFWARMNSGSDPG